MSRIEHSSKAAKYVEGDWKKVKNEECQIEKI